MSAALTRAQVRAALQQHMRASYGDCTSAEKETISRYISEAEEGGAVWGEPPYGTLEAIEHDYMLYREKGKA